MSRRALVTGVTGYIGGKLAARLLALGWDVDALVRPNSDTGAVAGGDRITFHRVAPGDSLTPAVAAARPDVVFHLASLYLAEHRPDQVADLVASNILFPALLAEAMSAAGATRIVNTGTAWQQFLGEPFLPVNLYAATKQAAEDLLAYYADAQRLSVITLRLFDTFGGGDTRRKLIQILVDAASSGVPLDMSPGDQIVDLSHVDDVVDAFVVAGERMLAADAPIRERYLVSGERYRVRELAAEVGRILGRPIDANFGGRPYRAREVMEPVVAAPDDRLPGWTPRRSLATSLSDLFAP